MNHSLHEKALLCVKNYKRSESDLIEILSQIDRTKTFLSLGVSSLFRYCVEKLRLSESETSRFIQVTRKSDEVPGLKEAINSGLLTVAKASKIASVITRDTQDLWIDKAATLTHREIEKEVAAINPKALKKERIAVKTSDRSELRVNISSHLEKKIKRAQEIFRAATLEETLEKLTDFALKRKDPIEKAKRVLSNKHLTCDTQSHFKAETRYIRASLRHSVVLRDKGKCQYKGCHSSHWTEIHHEKPLSQGGTHTLSNLITLCSSHHAMLHGFAKASWRLGPVVHK